MSGFYKKIILCADDYAQNEAITRGILQLIDARRLSAISCMTTVERWSKDAKALESRLPYVQINLHFNLTHGFALSEAWRRRYGEIFRGLFWILRQSYMNRLDPAVLREECWMQLYAFKKAMGCYPDGLDGHQHVHQFPGVREEILALYAEHQLTASIRNTGHEFGFSKEGYMIARLGRFAFRKRLHQASIPTNTSFLGAYPFKQAVHYRRYFNRFLERSQDRGLIMCHPGYHSGDLHDPLYASRPYEKAYFMSDAFLDDLAFHGVSCAYRRN